MTVNIRKHLAQLIKDHADFPAAWSVSPFSYIPDELDAPKVMVKQKTVEKTPGAPRTFWDVGFELVLLEPGLDPKPLEDALDRDIETLIDLIESIAKTDLNGLTWSNAERSTFEERFEGYNITLTITTTKE